jgi:MFS family permease
MPLRIFRSRNISVANGVQALMVAGIFGMFFLGALYLQQVLGYDAVDVGLAFLPIALAIAALSLGLSARLITRFGAKNTLIPGLAVLPIGLAYFARAPINADYLTDLFPAFLLLGIGAGLSFPSLMTLAMAGATQEESGLASGLVNTTQQVGGALGLAVLATIATSHTESLTAAGSSNAAALLGGFHVAWAIAAGLAALAFILAVTLLKPDHVAAAEVAQREEEFRVSRGLGAAPREAEQPEFAYATED